MTSSAIVRKSIALAVSTLFAGSAVAGIPTGVSVKKEHPRLYATAADFNRVALEAAAGPGTFPLRKGELRFTYTAAARGEEVLDAPVFGSWHSPNSLYIRYVDSAATPGTVRLQFVMERVVGTTRTAVFVTSVDVAVGQSHDYVVAWDTAARTASLKVDGVTQAAKWDTSKGDWAPTGQLFMVSGHKGDAMQNLSLHDLETLKVWSTPANQPIDMALARSWWGYLNRSRLVLKDIEACDTSSKPSDYCNTTRGGRGNITEPAKWLALAYRLSGHPDFLAGAKKHIGLLLKADLYAGEPDGPEWSMGARVGAMGIYYDWLYDALKDISPDGTVSYHQALAKRIKDTIAYDVVDENEDLLGSVCGNSFKNASGQMQTPAITQSPFACAVPPVFTNVPGFNIRTNYLSGHTASANTGSVLGLLAIADAHPEVKPLIDTIYDHFKLGYVRARDYISPDGGNQTLYAYGSSAGETADRLVMWKRALTGDPALALQSAKYMVYPYLYALRADGSFPARGDDYAFSLGERSVGSMALAGATSGDAYAADFYWNNVQRYRKGSDEALFEERLLYPKPTTVAPTTPLPLSRHFTRAGNVLMRDTWSHADATVLDFKSTSFISENHHHLDQNSFALSYKAPLLLDSGRYDGYDSVHWQNYYTRTIAHNTITAYDSTEDFKNRASNDGGQWFGTRATYPTIEQIMPGGSNALDGVTAYEEGGDFAYVAADASKAYVNGKLAGSGGFLRSIVYLRPQARTDHPKVIVFDSVRTAKPGIELTSLLHSVSKPTSTILPTSEHNNGRYRFDFGGPAQPLTIRNGEGMVTVQPLLPAESEIWLSGGLNEGSQCTQAYVPAGRYGPERMEFDSGDCRFLVRAKGTGQWRNYAILDKPPEPSHETDIGAWRVEISPRTAPAVGAAQYFLNVLHVDDTDGATSGAAAIEKATVLSTGDDTVAIALEDGRTFVFNGGAAPATTVRWILSPNPAAPVMVVGLVPNQNYTASIAFGPKVKMVLTQSASGTLRSSENGVLHMNR